MTRQAYNTMTPEQAYFHCKKHGRNEQLESIILTDPAYAYAYAMDVIKARWPEAENAVCTNPFWALDYTRVFTGRWLEGENVIATNSECAFYYAKNIIKGKLPELMHNMMLLHADDFAKEYLEFINYYE